MFRVVVFKEFSLYLKVKSNDLISMFISVTIELSRATIASIRIFFGHINHSLCSSNCFLSWSWFGFTGHNCHEPCVDLLHVCGKLVNLCINFFNCCQFRELLFIFSLLCVQLSSCFCRICATFSNSRFNVINWSLACGLCFNHTCGVFFLQCWCIDFGYLNLLLLRCCLCFWRCLWIHLLCTWSTQCVAHLRRSCLSWRCWRRLLCCSCCRPYWSFRSLPCFLIAISSSLVLLLPRSPLIRSCFIRISFSCTGRCVSNRCVSDRRGPTADQPISPAVVPFWDGTSIFSASATDIASGLSPCLCLRQTAEPSRSNWIWKYLAVDCCLICESKLVTDLS